jgi:cytochrome c oxidase subunit 4
MSLREAATAGASAAHEETVTGVGHAHPSDRTYVGVAVLLAAITALEVATFYVEEHLGSFLAPILLVMMTVKFLIVAGYFMHLKFDSNLFVRIFVAGVVLAILVYTAVLTTFEFWQGEGPNNQDTRQSLVVETLP